MLFNRAHIFYIFLQAFCLKLIASQPVSVEDSITSANNRLHYLRKRLEYLKPNVPAQFKADLNTFQESVERSYRSAELNVKNEFLANYTATLRPEFGAFLQEKFDEQILNAEINFEAWYLSELAKQVNATLAAEILAHLADYKRVLSIANMTEKFDSFTQIQDTYSADLNDILNAQPEPASIVNIDLTFTHDYLQHLLQDNIGAAKYQQNLRNALAEVELALNSNNLEMKNTVMEFYDDIETDFGRFLFDNMHEFWLKKFIN